MEEQIVKKGTKVPGIILMLLLIAAEAVFAAVVFYSGLMPEKYQLPGGIVLVLAAVLCAFLLLGGRQRIRFAAGVVLCLLLTAALAAASVWIYRFRQKMTDIMDTKAEKVRMSVYLRADDDAADTAATAAYSYGILASLDRENTDAFVKELEGETGSALHLKEYQGLTQLADSIRSKETDAIILNSAFMDIIREMEGYESIDDELRLLTQWTFSYDVQAPAGEAAVSRPPSAKTAAGQGADPETDTDTVEISDGTSAETQPGTQPETLPGTGGSSYVADQEGVYTIYISGIDSRDGLVARSRTDSNILAVANMDTRQVLILSTPRDYYIPLSISGGARDKLTHAGIYGIQVSMDTVGMLYETVIPYYVRVNFEGFTNIIDLLGGITVYSDYEFDSKNILGYHFVQGENQMNGEEALVFARERFSFTEGDRQRGKNQMAVIEGVLEKLDSTDILTSYSKYLDAMQGSFETNISYTMISDVVQKVVGHTDEWEVFTYSVDGTEGTEVPYSLTTPVYVMIPDESTVEHAKELIRMVKNGEKLTEENVS